MPEHFPVFVHDGFGEGHLPLCATPHYRSAAPITGLVEPAGCEFGFDMKVTRLREAIQRLPKASQPAVVHLWDADLPRTATRKVKRAEVKADYAERRRVSFRSGGGSPW